MDAQKITYEGKHVGDLWTAVNANEVKEVVNNNADALTEQKQALSALKTTVDSGLKQVFITQADYDALVAAGQVEAETLYNIYEE